MGKKIRALTCSLGMLLGQQWDWELLVTKNTCKSYYWVVCASTDPQIGLEYFIPSWHVVSQSMCELQTHIFPEKEANPHCVHRRLATVVLHWAWSRSSSNIWDCPSQVLSSFFSSRQNQALELLHARVDRKWDWKYVKLERSVLVADSDEGFITKG